MEVGTSHARKYGRSCLACELPSSTSRSRSADEISRPEKENPMQYAEAGVQPVPEEWPEVFLRKKRSNCTTHYAATAC